MRSHKIIDVTPRSRGLSLWTILVVLLVLALVSIATLGGFLYLKTSRTARIQNERDKLALELQAAATREAQRELEGKEATQKDRLALAINRQNELLGQAQKATNLLGRLLQEVDRVATEAATLRTNEAGRLVALHHDLVPQARWFYEGELRDLPSTQEIITKLEGVRRVEQQLVSARGTLYEPTAELSATAQNGIFSAEQGLRKAEQLKGLLSGLVQESKIKFTASPLTLASPTLEGAIAQLKQAETEVGQKLILNATSLAKTNAAEEIAKAEAQRIKDEARLQSAKIFVEASNALMRANAKQNEIARAEAQRITEEARLQSTKILVEASKSLIAANALTDQLKRQEVEQQNRQKIAEAQMQVAIQKAQAEALRILEEARKEARKLVLQAKAQDPEIKALLSPFTTPAYQQYKERSFEKQPFSYTELQSCGALGKTQHGLDVLGAIATREYYKERPRWSLRGGAQGWQRFPESMDQVKRAQDLLIEMGPVLVELKMLAP